MMDEMLKKYGMKYEDLNPMEKETLTHWMDALKQDSLTVSKVRDYIDSMRDSIIAEVSNYENGSRQDLLCKARLRNYTLLLSFLSTPEKAKQQLDKAIKNLV